MNVAPSAAATPLGIGTGAEAEAKAKVKCIIPNLWRIRIQSKWSMCNNNWLPFYIKIPCTQCHKAAVPAEATPLEPGTSASLAICVSISTRQIGQCLLVTSHWSTQSVWKRCIQGKRLQVLIYIYEYIFFNWLDLPLTEHRFQSQTRTNKLRISQHPRPIRWDAGHGDICGAMCCAQ